MKKLKLYSLAFGLYIFAFFILNLLPLPSFVAQGFSLDPSLTMHCSLNFWYCYSDFGGTVPHFPKILESPLFSLFILPIFLPLLFSFVILKQLNRKN